EFRDIAHPINSGTRAKIQEAVLAAYEVADEPAVNEESSADESIVEEN
ncbi:septation protein SpoVG family protein, partial [Listeria monocytogenes]